MGEHMSHWTVDKFGNFNLDGRRVAGMVHSGSKSADPYLSKKQALSLAFKMVEKLNENNSEFPIDSEVE